MIWISIVIRAAEVPLIVYFFVSMVFIQFASISKMDCHSSRTNASSFISLPLNNYVFRTQSLLLITMVLGLSFGLGNILA